MRLPARVVNMIRDFIMENVSNNPDTILSLAMHEFELSRPTSKKYIQQLIDEGYLEMTGTSRTPKYKIISKMLHQKKIVVTPQIEEHIVYQQEVLPFIKELPSNIRGIIQYGVTEMVNNVVDHSGSKTLGLVIQESYNDIEIDILDNGVGIFHKIQKELNLEAPSHAILELSKGKYTSDPSKHSGEGIFFTSRMFDRFVILSQNLYFSGHEGEDYLSEGRLKEGTMKGTMVIMSISKKSQTTTTDVFNAFCDVDSDPSFHKTMLSVKLMQFEGEELMSRSQAKRLMKRVERFKEVVLNFEDVKMIGQAFADEIFRVFKNEHPEILLIPMHANKDVDSMIKHAISNRTS